MAARRGCQVDLYEMRSIVDGALRSTPAHQTADFAELVCSNSLKSESRKQRAVAAEAGDAPRRMRPAGLRGCERGARRTRSGCRPGGILPPGSQRHRAGEPHHAFTGKKSPRSTRTNITIVATGPLTSPLALPEIARLTGSGQLAFYDSISPIVEADSIDMERVYFAARYDKGTADYINCPMSKEEYDRFYDALISAEAVEARNGRSWNTSKAACRSKN